MLQQKFYHSTIRKAIIAFGNLFNNIHIDRKDENGNVVQTLKVPLSYAPRQKFLARIEQSPDPDSQRYQVIIPRMAFELISLSYDPNRRIAPIQQSRAVNSTATTLNTAYAPTPYNLQVAMYAYVKNQDDGLQIIEQILPYFNPDFNLTLNAIPELGIKNDLPIILDNVNYEDQYEGDLIQRRAVIWTLNFTLKLNMFGPISKQGVIRTTTVNTFNKADLTDQLQRYSVSVTPDTAVPGDPIGFTETFEDF